MLRRMTVFRSLILAAGSLIAAGCHGARPGALGDTPVVNVLVYNVHAGKDAGGRENLDRVAGVIKQSGADVVLLQEVDKRTHRSGDVDQPAEYARLTGYHAAFGRSLNYDGGEYGIAILSRWPIRRDTTIHLPVDPPQERSGGSYEPRVAMRVTIAAPLGNIVVLNTHLDASGDDRWRRQEVRTIIALAQEQKAGGARRVLFGGDFNSTPDSPVQSELRSSGMTDSWERCGTGQGLSYPADTPVKRIDYLFLMAGAECTRGSVIDTQASDHRPVSFTIRFSN